jgi:predicted nucleotidyltransferase
MDDLSLDHLPLQIDSESLADFCRRNHIRRLALFGSVLRDDFSPRSDIDVLVEFDPGRVPGFAFFRLQDELSRLLGRTVDLETAQFLSRRFRDNVLANTLTLYEAA